jgi:ribonuclease HI
VRVELWTDGSGTHTRGPGGWAYVLVAIDDQGKVLREQEGSGAMETATNQTAELKAVVEGLHALEQITTVTVCTDSEYVMHGFTQGWVRRWRENGWVNRVGRPVANRDLWMELAGGVDMHDVRWRHVKGHLCQKICDSCGCERSRRRGKCPECATPLRVHYPHPYNHRCDQLAGMERKAMLAAIEGTHV